MGCPVAATEASPSRPCNHLGFPERFDDYSCPGMFTVTCRRGLPLPPLPRFLFLILFIPVYLLFYSPPFFTCSTFISFLCFSSSFLCPPPPLSSFLSSPLLHHPFPPLFPLLFILILHFLSLSLTSSPLHFSPFFF